MYACTHAYLSFGVCMCREIGIIIIRIFWWCLCLCEPELIVYKNDCRYVTVCHCHHNLFDFHLCVLHLCVHVCLVLRYYVEEHVNTYVDVMLVGSGVWDPTTRCGACVQHRILSCVRVLPVIAIAALTVMVLAKAKTMVSIGFVGYVSVCMSRDLSIETPDFDNGSLKRCIIRPSLGMYICEG